MLALAKTLVKKLKLAVLWVRRILLAPNHFSVSLSAKLWMNVHGFLADQYVLYDLRKGRRKDYLSEFDWYRSRWIDEPFDQMLNNKVVCTEILSRYALVPEILAVKTQGEIVLFGKASAVKSPQDVVSLICDRGAAFVKPISAGKGKGVHCIAFEDDRLFLDGYEVQKDALVHLLAQKDDWFVCERMKQSAYLDELYANAANTVRIITFRDPDEGRYKVFFAVQRIGTNATAPVDNGSKGGLVARIDLETGELSEARSLHSLDVHFVHPDTGCPIKGFRIPDWDHMMRCALDLAERLPYVRFVAWDLLATDEGICVVEANASSGVNIIQLWGPQRNGELGRFYKSRGVLK